MGWEYDNSIKTMQAEGGVNNVGYRLGKEVSGREGQWARKVNLVRNMNNILLVFSMY